MHCDVTNTLHRLEVLRYIETTYGRLDVLVLNAGITGYKGTQLRQTEEFFDKTFAVNVRSVFFMIKEAKPLLFKSEAANILVTSSITGLFPNRLLGVYAMGKAALLNMVAWLSHELMEYDIRVNAIAPGITRTNIIKKEIELGIDEVLPKKALASPDQIASMACMICAREDGKFVNGETFPLCGGFKL
jgi:NAD(P)-dependent dehydrogenase (short-subunit alcohol dehydrogenase family)